jgi:hypothetical protein
VQTFGSPTLKTKRFRVPNPANCESWASSRQVYWSKTTGNVTEFFDQAFKPLGWYSVQMNGCTYYAHSRGKNKFTFYDANMRQLNQPNQSGFWASFARGLAAGMAASGNAMQQAAAYRARQAQAYAMVPEPSVPYSYNSTTMGMSGLTTTTTTDSLGNSYITNSQRLGNFIFSTTTGSNSYTANSTTQRLGTFDFINGNSGFGSFTGTSNRIGNFDFTISQRQPELGTVRAHSSVISPFIT